MVDQESNGQQEVATPSDVPSIADFWNFDRGGGYPEPAAKLLEEGADPSESYNWVFHSSDSREDQIAKAIRMMEDAKFQGRPIPWDDIDHYLSMSTSAVDGKALDRYLEGITHRPRMLDRMSSMMQRAQGIFGGGREMAR